MTAIFPTGRARRILATVGAAAWVLVPAARAASDPAPSAPTAETALLRSIPNWSLSTTLNTAAGYKDNVLLSTANPSGSGFVRGEAEAMLLRLPERGWDGYAFLDVTEVRYFSARDTNHERSIFLTTEVRWQASPAIRVGVQSLAYLEDQVFDVSVTDAELSSALLKVTGVTLTPAVRWATDQGWWAEASGVARKEDYADHADDSEEGEGGVRLGRDRLGRFDLSAGLASRWRSYRHREQCTVAGRPRAGTHLKWRQRDATLNLAWSPDADRRWRGTLTALRQENRDNGSGYFDFNRDQLKMSVVWKREPWEVRCSASAGRYDFLVQQVGIGIAPEYRHRTETGLAAEITRRLTTAWSVNGSLESERALSNDDRSHYHVTTWYLGVQWDWDNLRLD
jgi:hypothetical protein